MNFQKLTNTDMTLKSQMAMLPTYIPTPPDGGWGWVIVAASLVCNIIVDGIGYAYGPIVSGLTNKFGCRPVTIAGSIVASLGFFIGSYADSVNILLVTYGVMGGFGFGLIYLPSIVSVGYYFEKKRALATGIAVCGSGIGTFMFSPVNNLLLRDFDWKYLLVIHAGLILNACVCGMLMRPLEPPKKKKKPARAKTVLDRVKEKAKYTRKRAGESESSVAVVETFAKLREAKQKREAALNENESDISSMPSQYFIKGKQDSISRQYKLSMSDRGESPSQPSSPVDVPKIVLPSTETEETHPVGSPESMSSKLSVEMENPTRNVDIHESHTKSQSNLDPNQTHLGNGVYVHEVEPLIENGYAKVVQRKSKSGSHAGSRFGLGSQRDMTVQKEDYKRPLYRKDIFYSGSIVHIPQYRSQPDVKSYVTSITSIPGDIDQPEVGWKFCTCLPKSVVDTLQEMLDISLLKNFPFLMICLGNILAMSGFYVPFSFLVDRAILLGIDETQAAFLLSVIGITNTIGRILAGFLADLRHVDSLVLNNVAMVIGGVSLLLEPFCLSYGLLITFASVYGLCIAAYISLTSIIICDILGLNKLTNAFGLLTLARGVSSIAGPPLAGLKVLASFDNLYYGVKGILKRLRMFLYFYTAYISLTSIIICDMLGLGKLTNAFGLLTMGRGIAGIVGPPIAGAVFQATGNYDASFLLGGGLFLAGAGCHLVLHLPCVRKRTREEDTIITAPDSDNVIETPPVKQEHVTIDETTNLKTD
ncbi:hypothetical protein KUTeg_006308 [Tegillarca granosa]|uniref:Monocarboxylate transporter n=1 Tax=Tegillarca granosa TaxID=220873 RepID=A0ABQ9FG71_TEGGR|nr:hypothetical protein KUTeg_006308 [Tegillarca granosa]